MAKLNPNYKNLPENYLFSEIVSKTKVFGEANPGVEILNLGIGNTTEALVPAVIKGLKAGVDRLSKVETYTGYGDEQGDIRLRQALVDWYEQRGIRLSANEIFISDGAKPDSANISSIFNANSVVAISDPVYPVYADSNIISGRRIVYMSSGEENGFIPDPPSEKVDLIFICSPNNPTGTVATKEQLKKFVDYCLKNRAILIFDAAYSEFIQDENLPKSIYQVEGARKCAIEIQSFSKSAGFTGVRLGWTVVPMDLITESGEKGEVNKLWNRRQTTMFNGASNIAQEGGLAILSDRGQKQTHDQIKYYMENARIIREGLESLGLKVFGGVNAPYIWVKCPQGLTSWEFFDHLLDEAHVVSTPGSGFGSRGEGYIRFSAFGHRQDIERAVKNIRTGLNL